MNALTKTLAFSPTLFTALILLLASAVHAQQPENGKLRSDGNDFSVWSSNSEDWVTPEAFWLDYALQSGGKYWGRSKTYPEYSQVNEHDTLLIENDAGVCLMYFFHERWRRAQDVRRWDPEFNEILGCPSVFD